MLSYFFDDTPAGDRTRPTGKAPGESAPSPYSPAGYETAPGKNRRFIGRGGALFLVFLFLLLGGAAAVFFLGGQSWDGTSASTGLSDSSSPTGATLERAPTGDGTVLTPAEPQGEALSFQEIYRKVLPSVVSITAMEPEGVSQGTGVVLTANGYVLTNAHVIENAFRVRIATWDNRTLDARLVGEDAESDLAVLKIEAMDLTPAAFGDSAQTVVGDSVVAIGNPLGDELRGTMTEGIISAINRDITVGDWPMTLMQTTAALNSGNSGGALVNRWGQVIGITNMKIMAQDSTIEGLGFAIPTATVKPIVDDLIACGHVTGRPSLGITVQALSAQEREKAGVEHGLWLKKIETGSQAGAAGLREGDILLSANGKQLDQVQDLLAVKEALKVGDVVTFQAMRDGRTFTAGVALVEQYTLNAG